jgi:hypothetical protein
VRWGSFALYGVKLHLICSTNRVPLSYELTAANVADVLLVRELLAGAGLEEGDVARRLLGDLAYHSGELGEELAGRGILLARARTRRLPPASSSAPPFLSVRYNYTFTITESHTRCKYKAMLTGEVFWT